MIKHIQKIHIILSLAILIQLPVHAFAQSEKMIHSRGMIHETVFNDGLISKTWQIPGLEETFFPLMEWPPYSSTIIGGKEYSGQHNSVGGGIWIGANPLGEPGNDNRLFALCGGSGTAGNTDLPAGVWSFPLEFERIENYPILPDGSLNPDYNPDEAEEIIRAKFATSTGITVTRTSRTWSYPDYDDMIIWEYSLENTGNMDSNPNTIERNGELRDVLVFFIYGFAPSMFGYQRHYNEWKYRDGIRAGDQRSMQDWDYWLSFNMNISSQNVDNTAFKPEPDPELFRRYAETGEMGGGLLSPQAPGFTILYYDTSHLAIVDPIDTTRNETEYIQNSKFKYDEDADEYYEIDENDHIKQPWALESDGGWNPAFAAINGYSGGVQMENWKARYSSQVYPNDLTNELFAGQFDDPTQFIGRATFQQGDINEGPQRSITFGPYTMKPGEVIEFSLAQVIGYGGEEGKLVEGGPGYEENWVNPIPSMNVKAVSPITGEVLTEAYLDEFGYPDYINSDVVNIQQVAHKAHQAYSGVQDENDLQVPVWPESNPVDGVYTIQPTWPAPVINVQNTPQGDVKVTWKPSAENFQHPRLSGNLTEYRVYRSEDGIAWNHLRSISTGSSMNNEVYEFYDTDDGFKVGETKFYAVTAVGDDGRESGRSNITEHDKNVGPVDSLTDVYVVPNPFFIESGFGGGAEAFKDQIGFYGLPEICTIRVFSFGGQLVETIEHNAELYSTAWLQTTRNNQSIASGIYFYVVTTPEGEHTSGKFVVIK